MTTFSPIVVKTFAIVSPPVIIANLPLSVATIVSPEPDVSADSGIVGGPKGPVAPVGPVSPAPVAPVGPVTPGSP